MGSFMGYLLGGYILWLFVAKSPSGAPWNSVMFKLVSSRNACSGGTSAGTASTTSTQPSTTGTTPASANPAFNNAQIYNFGGNGSSKSSANSAEFSNYNAGIQNYGQTTGSTTSGSGS